MSTITLPAILDRTSVGSLVEQLDQALSAGAMLLVAGGGVTRVGQSGLQLLLSAQHTAAARGSNLVVQASPAMMRAIEYSRLEDALVSIGDSHDQR